MDSEGFIRSMFEADAGISHIAIVNNEYRFIASKQREGVSSFTTLQTEKDFMSIIPPIIVDAVEKMQPFFGHLNGLVAHYEKVLMIFYRIGEMVVIVTYAPDVATPFYDKITGAFEKLSKQYLT